MGKLTETTQWEDDIYQLETSDPVLGGPDGVSNKPQKQLANRTQWLKQQLQEANGALTEHVKSRNHPDASLTAKGFVQLYSGVMSDSEVLAATPKAVKIAMDNANARLAKERNLADLTNIPLARQNLQLGDSATRNVGTTTNTVAAGNDSRITGAMQKEQNGADIPDKGKFVQNLGLKETLNPTKRVCIGSLGAGMFDGRLPSINIGDNDSGFIGSADGVIDIYTNSARAGYIDSSGLHMLRNIATTGTVNSGSGILTTNGDVYGSVWGNKWLSAWLSSAFASRDSNINTRATINYVNQTFVRDVRMGANQSGIVWGGGGGTLPAGYVLTGGNFDDAREYPVYAPVQKNINGVWYNVGRQ